MKKKTVVIGATDNPERYAYRATHRLLAHGHEVALVGIRKGEVAGHSILNLNDKPGIADVDTVTLYVGSRNLPAWYDYILGLQPRRIIFNPGTENGELRKMARANGIETVEGCTLVMLATETY